MSISCKELLLPETRQSRRPYPTDGAHVVGMNRLASVVNSIVDNISWQPDTLT